MQRVYRHFKTKLIACGLAGTLWLTPVYADLAAEMEEYLAPVVNDNRLEHIEEHLRYGTARALVPGNGPVAARDFRLWIRFFRENNNEQHLPQYITYKHGGIPQEPTLQRIKNVMAPAYLACLDRALQHCHRNAFQQFSQAYEQNVLTPLGEFETNTTQVKQDLEHRYRAYGGEVNQLLGGSLVQSVAKGAGVDSENAKRVERIIGGVGLLSTLFNGVELLVTGASQANPVMALGGLLFNIFKIGSGIRNYSLAKDYTFRALAFLKLYRFYEVRVLPYVSGLKASHQRPYDDLKQRFNETQCWNCGKTPGTQPTESPTMVQEICPQYFQKEGPFSRPNDLNPPAPTYGPNYRPPWDQPKPPR